MRGIPPLDLNLHEQALERHGDRLGVEGQRGAGSARARSGESFRLGGGDGDDAWMGRLVRTSADEDAEVLWGCARSIPPTIRQPPLCTA